MNLNLTKILYFITVSLAVCIIGCNNYQIEENVKCENEPKGLMPCTFWGKDEDSDLPWAFESTCTEGKCGDTHFGANEDHFFVSYMLFQTREDAEQRLKKELENSNRLIRSGNILSKDGKIIGQKHLFSRDTEERYANRYGIAWTRNERFAVVTAEKLETIELYESDRGL